MCSDRTICWLFTRICIAMLGLDLLASTYPIRCYRWRECNKRYKGRSSALFPEVIQPISIIYKLDAWSQYDNPEEGTAREGDLIDHSVSRKTTTTNQNLLWPNGIVRYFVDDTIVSEPEKLAVLENAMEKIMEVSCVRFIRIYPDLNGKISVRPWVKITGNDPGCYSDLGRTDVSPSILNLDVSRCFRTAGHAIHEILHTLGVFHEHMRPDRDEYIQILWENVKDGDAFNFEMMDNNAVTNYGLPYDYDSIMHYSMTAFSKNKSLPTILPRKKEAEIGQRNHLSFYDVQKLLISYKCYDVDSKNLYGQMDYDGHNVELLNFNKSKSLSVPSIKRGGISSLDASANIFRDYQSSYRITVDPTTIPIRWIPLTKLHYPEY